MCRHNCECKPGYFGTGETGDCTDTCTGRCQNEGICVKDKLGVAFCQCAGSFTGEDCEAKSEFAYIAGGITGAVIFVILLVLLIWMICVRATRVKKPEKAGLGPGAEQAHGANGVNFYYGAPAPYAESIAPSHHRSDTTMFLYFPFNLHSDWFHHMNLFPDTRSPAPTPTTTTTRRTGGTCPTSTTRAT